LKAKEQKKNYSRIKNKKKRRILYMEDGTNRLSRNVGKVLPLVAV